MADDRGSFIAKDVIDTIRERADIVQLISPYVPLKKAGKNYIAPCPFHKETKPSFAVNPVTQTFHCFGCGVGGNIFSFFMNYDNLAFPDAVQLIADRIGYRMPRVQAATPEDKKRRDELDVLREINQETASFFSNLLWKSPDNSMGREYLTHRGVSRKIADQFQIGLAPPPWDQLAQHLKKKGFAAHTLSKSGLLIQRDDGKSVYDRFRSRLMFPISNTRGSILGFAGRTLVGDDAKYINSPETPLFAKRKVLYGLHQSQEMIRRERMVLIVEGYFDLIILFQHGIQNIVATCGTALTDEHLSLIRRFSRTVRLVFDGDSAGVAAAARSLEMLIEGDLDVSVCRLPTGMDPDEFVTKEGPDAFRELLAASLPPFPFLIDAFTRDRDLSNADHVIAFLDDMTPYLRKITDPVRRSLIIKEIAEKAGVSHGDLTARLKEPAQGRPKPDSSLAVKRTFVDYEVECIKILLHYPKKIDQHRERLTSVTFRNEQLNEMLRSLISIWDLEQISHPDQWIQTWGVMPHMNLMTRFCTDDVVEANIDEQILGAINKARVWELTTQWNAKKRKIDQALAQGDSATADKLTREIMELSVTMKNLKERLK